MVKKLLGVFIVLTLLNCSQPVFAADDVDWNTLYTAKMEEIIAGYDNGTKDTGGVVVYGLSRPYFSVQDINFDGVPEMYHAICSMFELEPCVNGNEEIYYIKDGKVVQGQIEEGSSFCLIPMYQGEKAEPGDVTSPRWQFAMRDQKTGEVCFITNDSYSGFVGYPPITYSKLTFDNTTGVLKSEVLLHREMESYTEPVYLQGYEYVGADCYTSFSDRYGWGISDWKPAYIAPKEDSASITEEIKVFLNEKQLEFDVKPQIINDRTMVPLRRIFEALGAEVLWDDATNTVTAIKGNVTIKMTIGADTFLKNDEVIYLDSPAIIINSRTLVPVRAIAESFGANVSWEEKTKTVTIRDVFEQKIDETTVTKLINGELSFMDFDTKNYAFVQTLPQVNERYKGNPGRYAIIDLDQNGTDELVVEYNSTGDTAIITVKDGAFVAYYVPYRGIVGLKKDGTMDGSNGASQGSIHRISFTDEGMTYVNLVIFDSGEISGEPIYTIDGVNVSKDEVLNAFVLQGEKEDVTWIYIY